MSGAYFTKGPWVYKRFGGPQIGGGRGGATTICTLWGSWYGKPTRQERANCDLICAAPELYEAAEEARRQLEILGDDNMSPELADALDRLDHALAKARGETTPPTQDSKP